MGPHAFKQIFVVMDDQLVVARQVIHASQVRITAILHEQVECIKVLKEACEYGGSVPLYLGCVRYLCRREILSILKDVVHQMDIIIGGCQMHRIQTISFCLEQVTPIIHQQLEHVEICSVGIGSY
jgi:hypothetical protein